MRRLLLVILVIFCTYNLSSEESKLKSYEYRIFDGTLDSFTMRQMDLAYLSTSRLINRGVEAIFGDKKFLKIKISDWIDYAWPFFVYAVTHEEGHRSILTAQGIGSISQPFFNYHMTAYVKGVSDSTLINFRNTNKPSFIRMYTAGIESDYMMAKREEMYAAFEFDKFSILYPDYFLRRISIAGYLSAGIIYDAAEKSGGIYKWVTDLMNVVEEPDEYARDICGFDTFGAVRALFGNDYNFKRYVQFSDLTREEKDFLAKRMSYKSFLNYISLFLFTKPNINIKDKFAISGSMGYALAPFGDFIDENIYFKWRNTAWGDLNFYFYARQAENYNTWYPAFGVGIIELSPLEWFSISTEGHIWWQPEDMKFYTSNSFFGGAFELTVKLFLINSNWPLFIQKAGLTTSLLVKSKGFMPEIEQLDTSIRFSMGLEIAF